MNNTNSFSNQPLVQLSNIAFAVNGKDILHRINLEIYPNTVTTIIGPNGGGKSTLLRILLGLQEGYSGTVKKVPNLKIGYLPQKLNIDQSLPLTVDMLLRLAPSFEKETYHWLVETCDLEPILHTSIHSLSGGEKQRAFLARAIMNRPQLLVLDEPAQGVDLARQAYLYKLVGSIKNRFSCAVLLVSHDLMLVMKNTDHVLCLDKHICCEGKPDSIAHHQEFANIFGPVISQNLQEQFALYEHAGHHEEHNHHGNCCSDCCSDCSDDEKE